MPSTEAPRGDTEQRLLRPDATFGFSELSRLAFKCSILLQMPSEKKNKPGTLSGLGGRRPGFGSCIDVHSANCSKLGTSIDCGSFASRTQDPSDRNALA